CSSCSPYGCGYFATNGTMYGPIGNDPRPASCACSNCTGDLSGIGTGDFHISFTLTTTATVLSAVLGQRGICDKGPMWDVRLTPQGELEVETDDTDVNNYTLIYTVGAMNNGLPHAVKIARVSGALTVTVDGVVSASTLAPASFGALPALMNGTDICDSMDA